MLFTIDDYSRNYIICALGRTDFPVYNFCFVFGVHKCVSWLPSYHTMVCGMIVKALHCLTIIFSGNFSAESHPPDGREWKSMTQQKLILQSHKKP